jgi:DNA-directed RNA polymerase subunit RPC12/RpoP
MEAQLQCPRCGSEAYYNYGRTRNGKQRYLCLICNRQFVADTLSRSIVNRPTCPECASAMHIYMRHAQGIRFRCSRYPRCRGYLNISKDDLYEPEETLSVLK